jgi:hypothetical protein
LINLVVTSLSFPSAGREVAPLVDCGAVSMGATDDPVPDAERHDPDQCRRSTAAKEFAQ